MNYIYLFILTIFHSECWLGHLTKRQKSHYKVYWTLLRNSMIPQGTLELDKIV